MFIRRSKVKKRGRVYLYTQLVESFRGENGRPKTRVLHSFGQLDDVTHNNLRLAFRATSRGQPIVLATKQDRQPVPILDNLGYLPHAVLLTLWRQWGLDALIDELADDDARLVAMSDVLAALVIQRCVAPESKLAAVEWYRSTALPELLGSPIPSFNNTRVHRALDALSGIEAKLQNALCRRVVAHQGRPHLLFLDCSDTWFTCNGPPLASKRVGKEGTLKMQIGILLLCDQDGLPLRWATLPGGHDETGSMLRLARSISENQWARDAPLVMDRAMGNGRTLAQLQVAGVRFVTAVPRHEFGAYLHRFPLGAFDDTEPTLPALQKRAEELGLERVSETRFLVDLGLVDRGRRADGDGQATPLPSTSRATAFLLTALKFHGEVLDGASPTEVGARHGLSVHSVNRHLKLVALTKDLQKRILSGDGAQLGPGALRKIAALPASRQATAFQRATEAATGPALRPTTRITNLLDLARLHVRAVVAFNPVIFLSQRQNAEDTLQKAQAFVASLNRRLRKANGRRTDAAVLGEVQGYLRKRSLLSVFDLRMEPADGVNIVVMSLKTDAWKQRRAADGINLIVAHPDVPGTAHELVEQYFAKDKVEKDFRTIKSSLNLRPVYHRTDPKVCAHVSLCVLALLLQRTLERQLRTTGLQMTAEKAIQQLSTCHLNRFSTDVPMYGPTIPTQHQRALIRALDMNDLLDSDAISERITPR